MLAELKKLLPKEYGMWQPPGDGKRNYWTARAAGQLDYAAKLSGVLGGRYDELIGEVLSALLAELEEEGAITKKAVLDAERRLAPLAKDAKRYKAVCVAHGHIDMNWQWGWDETVAVTLDTFRTMLNLMNEYPGFTFSQSQAAVYRIVEQYDAPMLEEIRARVREGRWEVTAATWVEADKNMPSGESLTRQVLYSRKYLSELLGIDPDGLNLDYEPDTFGHSVHVPELLAAAGVKYYYFCRGHNGKSLFRWQAPSGRSVIAYREPMWYNDNIEPCFAAFIPELCEEYGIDTMLKVYGVGDHGGGPTRRDLELILDMQTWPIYPELRFGTYAEFFRAIEQSDAELPVVEGELNFVAPGCYTSQTRIKTANRTSEAGLNEAELFGAVARLQTGAPYAGRAFELTWRDVLFAQFHDILPGSGVVETREHAMGKFQEAMATINAAKKSALTKLAASIDTSGLAAVRDELLDSVSEGAGAGYGAGSFGITQAEAGRGRDRIYHLFNPSLHDREEVVELTIWDWLGDVKRIAATDADGNRLVHMVLDYGLNRYWAHHYARILVRAAVPAGGYATVVVSESDDFETEAVVSNLPRTSEHEHAFVLENDRLKVVFDNVDGSIVSLVDKSSGRDYADKTRPAGIFRFIEEEIGGGSAWDVGRYAAVRPLDRGVRLSRQRFGPELQFDKMYERFKVRNAALIPGELRQSIVYEAEFGSSKLKAVISLDWGSDELRYEVECDWREIGSQAERRVPQLGFHMPLNYACSSYRYDVPSGTIERGGRDMDVPGNSWALGVCGEAGAKSVMLVTRSKYGFRGVNDSLSLTLIRGSFDPDPYPEFGLIRFGFSVALADAGSNRALLERAYACNHPFSVVSGTVRSGSLPATRGFLELLEGSVALSAAKMSEEGDRFVLRVYETEGSRTRAAFKLPREAARAWMADVHERPLEGGLPVDIAGESVSFEVAPYGIATVCIEFSPERT